MESTLLPFFAWPPVYALAFQAIAIYAIVEYIDNGKRNWLLIAGGAAALTFLSKQNVGVYLFGAILVCSLLPRFQEKRKDHFLKVPAIVIAGFAIVMAVFVSWILANDAFAGWWLANFKWPKLWAKIYGAGFNLKTIAERLTVFRLIGGPDIFSPPRYRPDMIFVLMPFLTGFVFLHSMLRTIRRRAVERDVIIISLCLLSGASWLQYYPVPGLSHVWWSATPMIGLMVYGACRLSEYAKQRFTLQRRTTSIILIVMIAVFFAPAIGRRIVKHGVILHRALDSRPWGMTKAASNPFRGMIITAEQASYLDKVHAAISKYVDPENTSPPPLLFIGNRSLYQTFVPHSHAFHPLWTTANAPVIFRLFRKYLKKRRRFVVEKHPLVFIGDLEKEIGFPGRVFMTKFPKYRIVAQVSCTCASLHNPRTSHSFTILKWSD